jgi:hypothetical protein
VRESERSFIDNHKVTPCRVTPPLGARAPALTASTLPPVSVWPCGPPWWVGKHKRAQNAIGPSQSPSRSLETARPVKHASALDLCPGAKVSGSKTDLLTPWYDDGWGEIIPGGCTACVLPATSLCVPSVPSARARVGSLRLYIIGAKIT